MYSKECVRMFLFSRVSGKFGHVYYIVLKIVICVPHDILKNPSHTYIRARHVRMQKSLPQRDDIVYQDVFIIMSVSLVLLNFPEEVGWGWGSGLQSLIP